MRYADRVKELKKGDKQANILMLPRQTQNTIKYTAEVFENLPPFKSNTKSNDESSRIVYRRSSKDESKLINKTKNEIKTNKSTAKPHHANAPKPKEITKSPRVNIEALSEKHEQLIGVILAEEDDLINAHRKMIDEVVNCIKFQMEFLNDVDKPGSNVDTYIRQLDSVLNYKESMIKNMREKLSNFRDHLKEEEEITFMFEKAKSNMHILNIDHLDGNLLQEMNY